MLRLDALTQADCELVRQWRNNALETLRTPDRLTVDMQADFYRTTVCNRLSPHRFYRIAWEDVFIGCGGLTFIAWADGHAEISLIIDPEHRGKGLGKQAVRLLLDEAFYRLRLHQVFGEVYQVNVDAHGFWMKLAEDWHGKTTTLWARKFVDGKYWDSTYFAWFAEQWKAVA